MYCFFCFFNAYVFELCQCVYNMCCPCMIATIPLANGDKLTASSVRGEC